MNRTENAGGLYDNSWGSDGRCEPKCARYRCRLLIFIIGSIAWMSDGWFESKTSLVIQNAILLLINALGVWRWLPKAVKQ
jgi:hypothetical protein